jgi:murein DD-endopeptidase MepM/ murein hydrolase activator NlpD
MRRLAPILFALALMCACGRYPGFSGPPQGLEAGATPSAAPSTAPTGPRDDIPSTPGPGFIRGNAVYGAKKANGPRTSPTPSPRAPTASPTVQARFQAGARDNRRVLPAGFPFVICPVQGRYSYSDDFGAPRCTDGAASCGGYHLHMGNDILAAYGTPIVAPFDGRAVNATNMVGGNSVIVYGTQGFVFNAHLVAFGQLGPVAAGTVIGFVGNTGDARGGPTHDHFEWHPNRMPSTLWRSAYGKAEINGAVDPYPYLRVVCPPG